MDRNRFSSNSLFWSSVDAGFLSLLARSLVAQAADKTAFLTASGDKGHAFLIATGADAGVSLAELGPRVAAALDGRGGGSKTVFQGKATSLDRRADAVALLESFFAGH